jgi:hypothetical protein
MMTKWKGQFLLLLSSLSSTGDVPQNARPSIYPIQIDPMLGDEIYNAREQTQNPPINFNQLKNAKGDTRDAALTESFFCLPEK